MRRNFEGLRNERYEFVSRFPRTWQTKALGSVLYVILSLTVALGYLFIVETGLKADSIPSFAIYFSHYLLVASALATFFWFSKATEYFRVGALGYRIAAPPIICVFAIGLLLWVAPIAFDYRFGAALQRTASAEEAEKGYVQINKVAALIGANRHLEQLRQGPEFSYLPGPDVFSKQFIRATAADAAKPLTLFAPPPFKKLLIGFVEEGVSGCALAWSDESRQSQIEAAQRRDATNTEESLAIATQRALKIDGINREFERSRQQFTTCLEKAIEQTKLDKADLLENLATAQRNAYLIHIGYMVFGPDSANYREYTSRSDFAASELKPFGLGDLFVFAGVAWIIFWLSVLYAVGGYVESPALGDALKEDFFVIAFLAFIFFVVGRASPFQNSNILSGYDLVASTLHWPALALIPFALAWVILSFFRPSTSWTRSASVTTLVCLPIALAVECLNALNTLSWVSYSGGGCPAIGWLWTDQLHCRIYVVWQPIVKTIGDFLFQNLGWGTYWTKTAGRVGVSAAISILAAWPLAYVFLQFLKREYVRPRDK
jgi:hypothetical protein